MLKDKKRINKNKYLEKYIVNFDKKQEKDI